MMYQWRERVLALDQKSRRVGHRGQADGDQDDEPEADEDRRDRGTQAERHSDLSPSPTLRSTRRTASTVRFRLSKVRASPRASMMPMLPPPSRTSVTAAPSQVK